MPVSVVVGLEAVEVHHQHREPGTAGAVFLSDLLDDAREVALEGAVIAKPREGIGLCALADGVVLVGVPERIRRLPGKELDSSKSLSLKYTSRPPTRETLRAPSDLASAMSGTTTGSAGARGPECARIAQCVVGEDRLSADPPAHQPAAEWNLVAADLVGVLFAGEDRGHDLGRLVGPMTGCRTRRRREGRRRSFRGRRHGRAPTGGAR